jgi:putative membrane protein
MEANKSGNVNEHLANERTFLAWMRTGIGIMAFGFVVVKFSLFVKQLGLIVGKQLVLQQHGYSNIIGILLVIVGSASLILSFLEYKRTEKQINSGVYTSSSTLKTVLAIFLFAISICLIIYLLESI